MSQQQSLWHEDIYEALGTDIQALGGNKVVGPMLWSQMPPDKAGERLSSCLNRTRAEKLDPEQVLLIMRKAREVGSFATMWFSAQACNFEKPEPVDPESELAKRQREFIEASKSLQHMLADIERLSGGVSR